MSTGSCRGRIETTRCHHCWRLAQANETYISDSQAINLRMHLFVQAHQTMHAMTLVFREYTTHFQFMTLDCFVVDLHCCCLSSVLKVNIDTHNCIINTVCFNHNINGQCFTVTPQTPVCCCGAPVAPAAVVVVVGRLVGPPRQRRRNHT
jgi:hypothetical protein